MQGKSGFIAFGVVSVFGLGAPAWGQTLTVGLAAEPTSIDPHFHTTAPNNGLAMHIFERLAFTDANQNLRPGLATAWKPLDSTTWEFTLRQGVKCHDGTPFTADDVVYSMKRAPVVPNSPSGFGVYVKGKTTIKVDDHTVRFTTTEPDPEMAEELSQVAIVCRSAGEASTADFNLGKATIGTGPFKFAEYLPGDRIVLGRNDAYWGGKPAWRKVVFKPMKVGAARLAALLAGDVDMIDAVPTVDVPRLRTDPKVVLSGGPSSRVVFFALDVWRDVSPYVTGNDGKPIPNPLRDARVRKAISLAINRLGIVEHIMEGQGAPAGQMVPEAFPDASKKLEPVKHDPKAAKALLAEAGYPDGFRLTLHGPHGRYVNDAKVAEAVAQMLTRAGIRTAVEVVASAVYFTRASTGGADKTPEFSFFMGSWGNPLGNSSAVLKAIVHSYDKDKGFGASNRGRYVNPAVDAAIEEGGVTVDEGKRHALFQKAMETAIGADNAFIPLYFEGNAWGTRKGIVHVPRLDGRTVVIDTRPAP